MEIRFFLQTQNIKLMTISGKGIIMAHLGPWKVFLVSLLPGLTVNYKLMCLCK